MVSRWHRVPRSVFKTLFLKGAIYRSTLFTLRFLNTPEPRAFFAVTISAKEAKTAVLRNRIRRRLYEAIQADTLLPKTKGVFVFVAKKAVERVAFDDLKKAVLAAVDGIKEKSLLSKGSADRMMT